MFYPVRIALLLFITVSFGCQTDGDLRKSSEKHCERFEFELRKSTNASKVMEIQNRGLVGDTHTLQFCMEARGLGTATPVSVEFDKAQETLFWALYKADADSAPAAKAKEALRTMLRIVEKVNISEP
jgi:hypothetical protein